jgi:hypothetical protein
VGQHMGGSKNSITAGLVSGVLMVVSESKVSIYFNLL